MTLPATMFKVFAPTLVCSRDSVTGDLRIEGIASSTVRDHHGDAISQKALQKMADSALNMTIFMNHEYRVPQDVFGTVEKSRIIQTGEMDPRTKSEIWDLRFGIVVAKSNPDAIKTFELIEQDKVKLGLSIGAMLPDGGYKKDDSDGGRFLIDDIDIVETSMVGIPASPRSFVDYAVKAITGVFPESKKRVSAIDAFTKKYIAEMDDVDLEKDDTETLEAPEGLEAVPATTVTVGEDGPETVKQLDNPEEAEAAPIDPGVSRETTETETPEDDGEADDGSAGERVEDSVAPEHLAEGEFMAPLLVDGSPHPDITSQKGGHVHPHAHAHSHEHEHGYGETKSVHTHEHGHQHSHDHGADHEHDDTSNDYTHSHPHNGSYEEDHAHEESSKGAKKASLEPNSSKAKVTVWENSDGSKVTEVNTGRQRANADENQSVQNSSEPETTGGLAGAEADKTSVTDPVDAEILSALSEIVTKSGQNTALLLQKVIGQNRALKERITSLEGDRDTALMAAKTAIDGTAEIVRQVGRLPQGRKTLDSHPHVEKGLDDVSHIYSAEVRKLMNKRS